MKEYTYDIYQKCITETRDTWTLQAESKEKADRDIKEYAETGYSHNHTISCIESDVDLVWDALEATDDKPVIVDENNESIND